MIYQKQLVCLSLMIVLAGCSSKNAPATTVLAQPQVDNQPQPSPTVYNNAQPQIVVAYIGCMSGGASGTMATSSAHYIKMNMMLASDFTHPLATQVVPTSGFYNIQLFYPLQAPGTPLVLSVGLWDGHNYLSPTSLYKGNCLALTPAANDERIDYFTSNVTSISPDGCVNIAYSIVGAQDITLLSNVANKPSYLKIRDSPNQKTICLSAAGDYEAGQPISFLLLVTYQDGTIAMRKLDIPLTTIEQPPKIIGAELGCTSAIISGTVDETSTAAFVHVSLFNTGNDPAPFVSQDVPIINHAFSANVNYPMLPDGAQISGHAYLINGQNALSAFSEVNGGCIVPTPVLSGPPSSTPMPPYLDPTTAGILADGTVDLGTISVPAGLTKSLRIMSVKGWTEPQDSKSGVNWSWDNVPVGVAIKGISMAAPFQHIFYLTPSATTPVGSYQLTLNATNTEGTKHFSAMHILLNVLACQETFQPGTYRLTAQANQVTGGFGMGPDSLRGGVADRFTFCAGSQKRQLTITLLTAAGNTMQLGSHIPNAITFLRSASWPLITLSRTLLNFDAVADYNSEGKVFTWAVEPGVYIVYFEFGFEADPSDIVAYSAVLTTIK